MKTPVLLVGNFLSASGGSRGVCEELAARLVNAGLPVITTSRKTAKLARLTDMIATVIAQRKNYAVAQVDVYSGPAFIWAEAVCAALRWLNKPYILTLHGGNLPQFAQQNPRRVARLLASAKIVTTPSRFLQEKLAAFHENLRLLPNALDTHRYHFRLRENVKPSLLWLRAFHEIYNPALAPKVLREVTASFPEARLTMIGPDKKDGSFERTREIAARLNVQERICFPGGVAKYEVPVWLQSGDIFLNTTNVDNSPVSVLEAMAAGLCVISTNAGGLPYLLHHGETALLVPPNDAHAMGNAIKRLLTEPALAQRLSRQARAQAALHDWSAILPQWKILFESVAADRVPQRNMPKDHAEISPSCAA